MELTGDDRRRMRNNYARMIASSRSVRMGRIPYEGALNAMTSRDRSRYQGMFVQSGGPDRAHQRRLVGEMQSERGPVREHLSESFLDGGYLLDRSAIDSTVYTLLRKLLLGS